MGPIDSAFTDPLLENRDFVRTHRLGLALRILRHQIVRIVRFNSLDQFAVFRMPGHDRIWTARSFLQSRLTKIEPKSRLTHFRIGAVAAEATSCQDRLNVLIKIDGHATPGYR